MDESHIDSGRANAGGLQEELPWNRTGSGNDTFEEPYEGPEWLIVPLVFGLIFVVGVVGNGTLIFTVLVNKNMRTTPNVLLVSCMVNLDHRWIRSHVVIPLRVKHSLLFTKANCLANGDRFSLEIQYRMHSICQVYNRRFSRILSFYESQRLVGQPGCGWPPADTDHGAVQVDDIHIPLVAVRQRHLQAGRVHRLAVPRRLGLYSHSTQCWAVHGNRPPDERGQPFNGRCLLVSGPYSTGRWRDLGLCCGTGVRGTRGGQGDSRPVRHMSDVPWRVGRSVRTFPSHLPLHRLLRAAHHNHRVFLRTDGAYAVRQCQADARRGWKRIRCQTGRYYIMFQNRKKLRLTSLQRRFDIT